MSMLWPIVIASLCIPALIFILFLVAGLAYLGTALFDDGQYSTGWFGIVYAGAMYAYISVLVSAIPTVVLGLPLSLAAKKFGCLNNKVVLMGAVITGGLYLGIAAALYLETVNIQIFLLAMFLGGVGGLLNGYVFFGLAKSDE